MIGQVAIFTIPVRPCNLFHILDDSSDLQIAHLFRPASPAAVFKCILAPWNFTPIFYSLMGDHVGSTSHLRERIVDACKAMKGAWKWYFRGRWNLSWTPGAEIRVKLFLCRVQPLLEHKGWHCGLIVYLKQTLQEQFPSFILQYDCTVATDISTWFQTKILWSE